MNEIVKTSDKDWIEKALKMYTEKKMFEFIDDAKIGLTKEDLSSAIHLIRALRKSHKLSLKKIVGVLSGLGITGIGVYLILLAIGDPEPTTKLGLLIGGGLVITLTGSLGTLAALGYSFKVTGRSSKGDSFEIKPHFDN